MTLQLRRKRQITVPNTQPVTSPTDRRGRRGLVRHWRRLFLVGALTLTTAPGWLAGGFGGSSNEVCAEQPASTAAWQPKGTGAASRRVTTTPSRSSVLPKPFDE